MSKVKGFYNFLSSFLSTAFSRLKAEKKPASTIKLEDKKAAAPKDDLKKNESAVKDSKSSELPKAPDLKESTKALVKESSLKKTKSKSNHLQPFRPVNFKSTDSLRIAEQVWTMAILTLPIDILAFYYIQTFWGTFEAVPAKITSLSILIFVSVLTASLLYIDPRVVYLSLRKLHSKFEKITGTKLYWAIIVLIVALPLAELAIKFSNFKGNLGLIIFLAAAVLSFFHTTKEFKKQFKKLKADSLDPIAIIEKANKELFAFSLIPMISARTLSMVGLVYLLESGGSILQMTGFTLCSLFALLNFKPIKKHYMVPCPSCYLLTTAVILEFGCCPACNRDRFQKKVANEPKKDDIKKEKKGTEIQQKESWLERHKKEIISLIAKVRANLPKKQSKTA